MIAQRTWLVVGAVGVAGLVALLASRPQDNAPATATPEPPGQVESDADRVAAILAELPRPFPADAKVSVQAKKDRFFGFLAPLVEQENQRILGVRQRLKTLLAQINNGATLHEADRTWVENLGKDYRVPIALDEAGEGAYVTRLLKRVDVIPLSLALSQSANESAWGTSRFAVEGNNYFGQWCFEPGCGLVPEGRPKGKKYEVAAFDDPYGSVRAYIKNLNSHPMYQELRDIRAELRTYGETPSGSALSEGLERYSARGEAYIDELQSMIRFNNLDEVTAESFATPAG